MMKLAPRIEKKFLPQQLLLFKNKCSACKGDGVYTYINFRFTEVTVKCPLCKGCGFKD